MAEAKKTEKKTVEETITLTLSREEAEALLTVTGSIGGSQKTARKHTSAVYYALLDLGISAKFNKYKSGSFQFNESPVSFY